MNKRIRARLEKENRHMKIRIAILVVLVISSLVVKHYALIGITLLAYIEFVVWTKRK